MKITSYDVTPIMGLESTSTRLKPCALPTEQWTLQYNGLKALYLELLTGAIGSPQGPAHYDVMSWVFNKVSKQRLCISPQVSWCMLAAT